MKPDKHLTRDSKILCFIFGVISGLIFVALFIASQPHCYGGSDFLGLC